MDNTPLLITPEEYNKKVTGWATTTRSRMARNLPKISGKLLRSLTKHIKKEYGEASRITYNFERHGVFVHYGVGRGYIRVGNMVVAGRRLSQYEKDRLMKRGESKRDVNKLKVINHSAMVSRQENDWFDVEIKLGMNKLADIVQEYRGDEAMKMLLAKFDKITIRKKI